MSEQVAFSGDTTIAPPRRSWRYEAERAASLTLSRSRDVALALEPRAPAPGAAREDVRKSFSFHAQAAQPKIQRFQYRSDSEERQIPHNIHEGRGPLVAAHDDLEEVLGRGVWQPLHPEIVDDQQGDAGDLRKELFARSGELGVSELVDERVGLAVQDPMALLDDGEADRVGQMALAGAGRTEEEAAC
jgi:hypothetical protein